MAEISGRPLFSPQVITINEFIEQLSNYQQVDKIELLVLLYDIYIAISESDEPFDDFVYWGEMLLSDFLETKDLLKFSRIPIYSGEEENITGYVITQDVFEKLAQDRHELRLKDVRREIIIVPNTIVLFLLWENMLEEKEQIALILDEYGGVDGIVTMEDIVETLLGLEIVDEKDVVDDMQKYAKDKWRKRQARYNVIAKLNKGKRDRGHD